MADSITKLQDEVSRLKLAIDDVQKAINGLKFDEPYPKYSRQFRVYWRLLCIIQAEMENNGEVLDTDNCEVISLTKKHFLRFFRYIQDPVWRKHNVISEFV